MRIAEANDAEQLVVHRIDDRDSVGELIGRVDAVYDELIGMSGAEAAPALVRPRSLAHDESVAASRAVKIEVRFMSRLLGHVRAVDRFRVDLSCG